MTFWDFIASNPWWSFGALLVIATCFPTVSIKYTPGSKKPKELGEEKKP